MLLQEALVVEEPVDVRSLEVVGDLVELGFEQVQLGAEHLQPGETWKRRPRFRPGAPKSR